MSSAARTKFHLLSIALLSFLYCGCIHASEAQAADGVSAATRRLYPDRAFRIGLIELSDTQKVKGLVARSVKELRKAFFPYQIEIQQYASRDLEQAIKSKSVDAFIAISFFY